MFTLLSGRQKTFSICLITFLLLFSFSSPSNTDDSSSSSTPAPAPLQLTSNKYDYYDYGDKKDKSKKDKYDYYDYGGKHGKHGKHGKDKKSKDPIKPGFPGGKPPVGRKCTTIPGCRTCPGREVCTVCYYNFGGSRFQLRNGACRCPPGTGSLEPIDYYYYDEVEISPGTPWWAAACKPCPNGTFSLGGNLLDAVCTPCESGFTSLPASAACTIRTDCEIGQQPNDRGNCVPCRIGAYQDTPSTGVCKPCPKNFTTIDTGSTSINDCIVPICPAGTQLQTFDTGPNADKAYWCEPCTGLAISKAGRVWQGTRQPACEDCILPSVPTRDRTQCARNICPPPDVFKINCTTAPRTCPGVSVSPRRVYLPSLCSVSPQGAVLTWYRATSCTTNGTCNVDFHTPVEPPLASCPATGVFGAADPYLPYITSFNGRTDCLCPVGQINCNFVTGLNTLVSFKPQTANDVSPANTTVLIVN